MDNEFKRITLTCDGTYVVPRNPPGLSTYPEVVGPNQACTLYGATPGLDTVDGASYIAGGYFLNVHDLWRRNFIVLIGWFLFYQIAQVLLIEYLNVSLFYMLGILGGADAVSLGVIRTSGCRDLQEGEPRDQGFERDAQGAKGHPREGSRHHRLNGEEVVPGSQDFYVGGG